MDDKARMLKIKEKISELSNKKLRLEGQFDTVKQSMVDKYETTSIQTLITKKSELTAAKDVLQSEIEKILSSTESLLIDN